MRRAVLALSIPAVFEGLLQILFNLTDMFWVGRGLGPAALAGVSTASFMVWLTLSVGEMAAIGLTAVQSRRLGEGRRREAARTVYQAFALAVLLSLILGAAGLAALPYLFLLMGTPTEVTVQGAAYLSVYLTGVPLVFCYFVMAAAFRASGDTRTPLYLLGVSVTLNLILDPLVILGVGPFPRLEVQGAALATLLTRGLGCLIGYSLLVRRQIVERVRPRLPVMLKIARIGLPVSIGGAVFSMVYMALTRVTSQFGTAALAALGVGHRVESVSFMACLGFGFAAATAVGQNLGAGRPDRAERAGRVATVAALAVTGVAGAVFLVAPEQVMSVFSHDPEVIRAGGTYLRIVAVAQVFMALHLVPEIGMEGAGYTLLPMLSTVVLTMLRLPLAWGLSTVVGLAGVWWAISSTTVVRGLVAAAIWQAGRWKRRAV